MLNTTDPNVLCNFVFYNNSIRKRRCAIPSSNPYHDQGTFQISVSSIGKLYNLQYYPAITGLRFQWKIPFCFFFWFNKAFTSIFHPVFFHVQNSLLNWHCFCVSFHLGLVTPKIYNNFERNNQSYIMEPFQNNLIDQF